MKNLKVTGYKMVRNQDTYDMERTGQLTTIAIDSEFDCEDLERLEFEISKKMGFDWFDALTIQ